jgi:hypothetical protein
MRHQRKLLTWQKIAMCRLHLAGEKKRLLII